MTVIGHGYDDNVGAPAFRNMIINGAMQVAQRGTSATAITGTTYNTADRWGLEINALGTWTQTVTADAPTGSGFRNCLKMLCTTADASPAAGDFLRVVQFLEGQDLQRLRKGTASATSISMSFWVKSNKIGTYICELFDEDNTRQVSKSYTVAVADTWEQKTIVFPADATGVFDNDNAKSLIASFHLADGSTFTSGTLNTTWAANTSANRAVGQVNLAAATSNYWQVTGVQLEAGPVATPFEFEPFETTMRKCQRYFYSNVTEGAYGQIAIGLANTTSSAVAPIFLPVRMRAKPASVAFANLRIWGGAGAASVSSIALDWEGPVVCGLFIQGASAVLNISDAVILQGNNTVGAYLTLSAEL